MNHNPAIIIVAYNRPKSLKRLLDSLSNAKYNKQNITLVISVDFSDVQVVKDVAESFDWPYGEKNIIEHQTHLGLKDHILKCGDLTNVYESVIILEDDLVVSPYFYDYAVKSVDYYKNDENVAGVSLYNYQITELGFRSFVPIDDSTDVYFMQVASSWGQVWVKEKWHQFKTWYDQNLIIPKTSVLPSYLFEWSENSWKKHFIHYLIKTNRYFVFPRLSLSTNFEDEGTNSTTKNIFQVPLQASPKNYCFCILRNSTSKYDAWFELEESCYKKLNPFLAEYNFDVDLYGYKGNDYSQKTITLTSKNSSSRIVSFGSNLLPLENNVIQDFKGNDLVLAYKMDVIETDLNIRVHKFNSSSLNQNLHINVLLVVKDFELAGFDKTYQSVIRQNYDSVTVTILAKDNIVRNLKNNYILSKKIAHHFIVAISGITEGLIGESFLKVKADINCFLYAGSILNQHALFDVNSIFKRFDFINWISAINEKQTVTQQIYCDRFVEHDLEELKNKQHFNYSVEGDFFREHCLNKSQHKHLFFDLIENYQQIKVARHFISKNKDEQNPEIDDKNIENYRSYFSACQIKITYRSKFFKWLLNVTQNEGKLYQYALFNYPDVLRFDTENHVFYLHKS